MPTLSNFLSTGGGTSTPLPVSWFATAEFGKTLYVGVRYLTYKGDGVLQATFNGIAMEKQNAIETAFAQFHTIELFSLTNPPPGPFLVEVTGTGGIFRTFSFNIADGPTDGCVTGVYAINSGVTARYLYGFGYNPADLIVYYFDSFNSATTYTVTDGTPLVQADRFAMAYKQADGFETMAAFDTGGDTAGGEQFGVVFTIPSGSSNVNAGGAYQPWMGRVSLGSSDSVIALPHCGQALGTPTAPVSFPNTHLTSGGTIRNVRINLKTPNPVGTTRTFTVYKNGVPTSLTGTIPAGGDVLTITGIDKVCYQWSLVDIRHTFTGLPGATEATYCVEFESGATGISVYGPSRFGGSSAPTLGNSGHSNLFSSALPIGGPGTWTLSRWDEGRIGCNGDLIGYFITYFLEIGQSKYDAYVWKSTDDGVSYVRQDGTGGTPNTYRQLTRPSGVTQPGKSFWFVPVEVPLAVGDQAFVEVTGTDNTGAGLNNIMTVNAVFRATVNGEFFFNGETTNASDNFYDPHQNRIANPTSTETEGEYVVGPLTVPFVIPGTNWAVETPPGGATKTRTMSLRHNGADGILAVITDTERSAEGGVVLTLPTDDVFAVQLTQANAPAGTNTQWWTIRGFMSPPAPPPPPECPGLVTSGRTDGLPYVPPTADPCDGTGERGAPRIGA